MSAFSSLTGGMPTKSLDMAASVVFATAYLAINALIIWRFSEWGRKENRIWSLLRPAIFVQLQVAAYVIRAIQANGSTSTTLYIVAQILLIAGVVLIIDPLPSLLLRIVGGYDRKNPDLTYWYLLRLTQATLVGALGLAAFAAAKISPKMTDDEKQANLTLREASAALCLGAGAVCQVVAALFLKRPLVRKGAFYMLCVSSLVVVTSAYKLFIAFKPSEPTSVAGKVAFYILVSLCQWLIATFFFAFDMVALYPTPEFYPDAIPLKSPRSSSLASEE